MTRFNLDGLKETDYFLYQIASRASGLKTGICEIDISNLKIAPTTRSRLAAAAMPPPQKPEPPKSAIDLSESFNVVAYEKEQLQRAADEARGIARLYQFQREQGLRDCKENADAIRDWLDQNLKGYVSEAGIDACILNLGARGKNVLLWDSVNTAPPPPPPAEPAGEVLAGWQLPLDADERTMRKASTKALLDLNQRRRKATNQLYVRRSGSRGASF